MPRRDFRSGHSLGNALRGHGLHGGYQGGLSDHAKAAWGPSIGRSAMNAERRASDPIEPELQEVADKVTIALAEKFARPESDFTVIDGRKELITRKGSVIVALTATEGISMPEFDRLVGLTPEGAEPVNDDPLFVVEIDGREFRVEGHMELDLLDRIATANPGISEYVNQNLPGDARPGGRTRGGNAIIVRKGFAEYGLFGDCVSDERLHARPMVVIHEQWPA